MTTTTMTRSEGRELAIARKRFRRDVAMGRASWSDRLPKAEPKPVRTFGQGLGERHPIHRLPVPLSDLAWWAEECARAEAADLEQRAGEFEAAGRLEACGCF